MTNMIKWQSYKDHIDEVLKKSQEVSSEIYNLSQGGGDEELDEKYDGNSIMDDIDIDGHIPFLLPKSITRDLAISLFHECWIGYTNFNVDEEISTIINECPGVELLRISGRYTFIVGIGKCFKFSEIRENINKSLKVGKRSITKKDKNSAE